MKNYFGSWILILTPAFLLCQDDPSTTQLVLEQYPIELECEIGKLGELVIPSAHSTCQDEVIKVIRDETASGGCLGTVIRTITYTDQCGHEAQAQQFIRLTDHEAPVIIDLQEELLVDEGQSLPGLKSVRATDNSGEEVEISFTDKKEGNLLLRTWKAVDVCGNASSIVQKITIKH